MEKNINDLEASVHSTGIHPYDTQKSSGSWRFAKLGIFVVGLWFISMSMPSNPLGWSTSLADMCNVPSKLVASTPEERASYLLKCSPVIDGHVDTPIQAREKFANQYTQLNLTYGSSGHVDVPRLRKGQSGGFFWSVYVDCPGLAGYEDEETTNFTQPSFRVRDTLEQIDVARLLIESNPDFELTLTANDWRSAMRRGKFGGMLGVEGGHQLGNSLSTLRMYYELGVRYVTLTHVCNNAFADTCGYDNFPLYERWGGLSPFGHELVREMNRLGVIVDVSHTADQTARDALKVSEAPVIFSHSNARSVHNSRRNLPDDILESIGRLNKNPKDRSDIRAGDSIVMVNFGPQFVADYKSSDIQGHKTNATLSKLVDHIEYIGRLAGRNHVGIGSDFDGITSVPVGLEDVSKYPDVFAELVRRGWSDSEIRGVASENILRILDKVERTKSDLAGLAPVTSIYEGRTDLGHPNGKRPFK